jgi:putative ABC transport system permease protein
MNLALRDVHYHLGSFVFTTIGIGLLLMIVMGMGGIYRGLVDDATFLIDRIDADLWVVQRDTRGPFAEISRLPSSLEDRLRAVPGVAASRRFVSHTIQRDHGGGSLRMTVQGLAWPDDRGAWLPLMAGHHLDAAHYGLIADRSLGLGLGETLQLGHDSYTVVGITAGMVSQAGDGMGFFTCADALAIQNDSDGESQRLERAARSARVDAADIGHTQPALIERAGGASGNLPVLAPPPVSAVMVWVAPGADPAQVALVIAGWGDASVYTSAEQRDLLLAGPVDKARRQLGLFRVLLIVISAIIMALVIYTMTLDKVHDIALLKLMGARNRVIVGLILQQALLLGALGYGIAWLLGQRIFPLFPRRVLIVEQDLLMLAGIVIGISVLASGLGVWKAMRVRAGEVLS